jgi:peptidoglycan/xylan/chitin deacetylase (PgdA/CDA1 family)
MIANWLRFSDEVSLLKMDLLTGLGRKILPSGHWGSVKPGRQNDYQAVTVESNKTRSIYLTFDDGPHPQTTRQLLELLELEQVTANFFLIGSHAERYPELTQEISRRGHVIGNHSLSHLVMPLISTKGIEREVHRSNAILRALTGKEPRFFRPPYGLIDKRAAHCLDEVGMKIVYWGAVPEDWLAVGADRVVERVVRKLSDGTIIVLHEQRRIAKQTLTATKRLIDRCRAMGFEFKSLDSLA